MMTSTKGTTARRLGRIVAGGVVALLLAGSVAETTEARTRHSAQGHLDMCFDAGGESAYWSMAGYWFVGCQHLDGTMDLWGENGAIGGEQAMAADDRGKRAADADHERQKTHKYKHKHKHKSRAGKRS